jgi:hypothetical protein
VLAAALANPLVEFNDSQVGVYLGSVLHTLGAIALLGGVVAYVAWHRQLAQAGHHHRGALEAGMLLTYVAIVVNLLGGFMRTVQSGHPHLWQFAESPWVRAIAVKHVFLLAGMAAAVYLFERVAPRLVRRHKAGTLGDASPAGHRVGVLLAVLGIVVAAILGAVTQVVPLVSAGDGEGEGHDHAALGVLHHNATGQLTSTPLAPAASTGTFQVPNGTIRLDAALSWTPPQSSLRLELESPAGVRHTASGGNGGTPLLPRHAPQPGTWTYRVASDLAFEAAWELSIRLTTAPPGADTFGGSVTIPPGRFFEVNTQMQENATLSWAWQASGSVHFDVHSHFDGEVQLHASEEAATGEGTFTSGRAGGYSLLWENTGSQPVTLDHLAWGDFELDSVFPAP